MSSDIISVEGSSYSRGFYNVNKARNDMNKYKAKAKQEQFFEAAKTAMFDTLHGKIQDAANEGFSQITIYPVETAEYDKFYNENPSTLGPSVDMTNFTPEQEKIIRAFEELGFTTYIDKNANYKPKNMPSMTNGGWTYNVDSAIISW